MSFNCRKVLFVNFVVVFLVEFVLHRVTCQVTFDQPCPKLKVVQQFDLHKYLGLWYEIESYPAVFSSFRSCVTANYSLLPDGNVRVINRSFNTSSNSFDSVDGRARLIDPSKMEGKLGVDFPGSPFNRPVPAEGNYWVLDTDYINYSVVWSCESFNSKSFQFLWFLSRLRHPSDAGLAFVRSRIDSFGLDRKFLEKTEQRKCPADDNNRGGSQRPPTSNS